MKKVLIVHHASNVTETQIEAFLNEVPESIRSESEIKYKKHSNMPDGLIAATPKTMKERGLEIIGKRKVR